MISNYEMSRVLYCLRAWATNDRIVLTGSCSLLEDHEWYLLPFPEIKYLTKIHENETTYDFYSRILSNLAPQISVDCYPVYDHEEGVFLVYYDQYCMECINRSTHLLDSVGMQFETKRSYFKDFSEQLGFLFYQGLDGNWRELYGHGLIFDDYSIFGIGSLPYLPNNGFYWASNLSFFEKFVFGDGYNAITNPT